MQDLIYGQLMVKEKLDLRKKCIYCNKKFEVGQIVEYVMNSAAYHPFCLGHMEVWTKEKRLGFLLEKL